MERKEDSLNNLFGCVIVAPIMLVLVILFSPVLLCFLIVHGPLSSFKKYRFLKRNKDKRILCISTGRKFQVWRAHYQKEILALGIDDVVVFDSNKSNNQYDDFGWDKMILRDTGFPVLITINGKVTTQQSLKVEFVSFFKKEIDWMQLQECIKRKVNGDKE